MMEVSSDSLIKISTCLAFLSFILILQSCNHDQCEAFRGDYGRIDPKIPLMKPIHDRDRDSIILKINNCFSRFPYRGKLQKLHFSESMTLDGIDSYYFFILENITDVEVVYSISKDGKIKSAYDYSPL